MALTSIVLGGSERGNEKKDTKQLFFTGLYIFHSKEFGNRGFQSFFSVGLL